MKLKEYVKNLNAFLENRPELGEMEVHYSSDPEGNRFYPVYYHPSAGVIVEDSFIEENDLEEEREEYGEDLEVNAVVIN